MTYQEFRDQIDNLKNKQGYLTIPLLNMKIEIDDSDKIATMLYPLFFDNSSYYPPKEGNYTFEHIKKAYDTINQFDEYPRVLMNGKDTRKVMGDRNISYYENSNLKDNYILLNDQVHFSINNNEEEINSIKEIAKTTTLDCIIFYKNNAVLYVADNEVILNNFAYFMPHLIEASHKLGLQFLDFSGAYLIHNLNISQEKKDYFLDNNDSKLLLTMYTVFARKGYNLQYFNNKEKNLLKKINKASVSDIEHISYEIPEEIKG